jgi:hypothetical protein
MGALDSVHSKAILDASTDQTGAAVRLSTGPFRLRQMTANGTNIANGTEVATGGGYTAGVGAPTIAFGGATGTTSPQAANSGAVNITNYPRAETVVGIEVWDSAGTPLRKWWGALGTPKTMAAGDSLSYAIGAVIVQLP